MEQMLQIYLINDFIPYCFEKTFQINFINDYTNYIENVSNSNKKSFQLFALDNVLNSYYKWFHPIALKMIQIHIITEFNPLHNELKEGNLFLICIANF